MDKDSAKKQPRDLALAMSRLLKGYTAVEIMTAISTLSAAVFVDGINADRRADPDAFLETFEKTFLMASSAILNNREKRQQGKSH